MDDMSDKDPSLTHIILYVHMLWIAEYRDYQIERSFTQRSKMLEWITQYQSQSCDIPPFFCLYLIEYLRFFFYYYHDNDRYLTWSKGPNYRTAKRNC